jgi:hypothetical protein
MAIAAVRCLIDSSDLEHAIPVAIPQSPQVV